MQVDESRPGRFRLMCVFRRSVIKRQLPPRSVTERFRRGCLPDIAGPCVAVGSGTAEVYSGSPCVPRLQSRLTVSAVARN